MHKTNIKLYKKLTRGPNVWMNNVNNFNPKLNILNKSENATYKLFVMYLQKETRPVIKHSS